MKSERSGLSRLAMTVGTVIVLASGVACTAAGPPPGSDTEIPRLPDGKLDFSGIWQALTTASWNLEDHSAEEGGAGWADGRRPRHDPLPRMGARKEERELRQPGDA